MASGQITNREGTQPHPSADNCIKVSLSMSLPTQGFPCGSASKESACNAGNLGSIPGLGKSPGEGKDYSLQYSGMENSMYCMDCLVQGVAKIGTRLSNFHFTSLPTRARPSFPHSQSLPSGSLHSTCLLSSSTRWQTEEIRTTIPSVSRTNITITESYQNEKKQDYVPDERNPQKNN